MIEHIDEQVGRVLTYLEATGLADTTYLMFTSDHGDNHGSHGHFRKMTPHEESIRVPLIIWGGKRWHYGGAKRLPHVTNHVDLAPTSLGLAGITPPQCMQGFDYSACARNPAYQPEPAPAVGPNLDQAPDSAYLQVVVPTGHRTAVDQAWRGIVTEDGWKYVAVRGQPWMMYDLNTDPYEQCNLVFHGHARGKRLELQQRLARWIEDTDDEFILPEFDENGRPAEISELQAQFSHLLR